VWHHFDDLRPSTSEKIVSTTEKQEEEGERTFDESIVGVESGEMVSLLDRELPPLELATNRVAVIGDEDVLQVEVVSRGGKEE
jgi:hypothetical protein